MNSKVTATNMMVKAVAEQGILINEVATYNSDSWDNVATTTQTEGIPLRATSTANTKDWFVAYSKVSDSAASASSTANSINLTDAGYTALTFAASPQSTAANAGTNAQTDIYWVDKDGSTSYQAGEGYYVKYTYYIKSSSDAITCGLTAGAQNLNIEAPTVTGNTNSALLDQSLRVAVVVAGKAYIFAPLNSISTTYYVGTNHVPTTTLTGDQATSLTSSPATTQDGVAVHVYIYFEGEDANCKTQNITSTLDDLTVEVGFKLVDNAANVTDNGVTIPTT